MIDGPKLRAFRARRDVSQEQVAIELQRSKARVSQMERKTATLEGAERYLNAIERICARRLELVPTIVTLRVVADADGPGSWPSRTLAEFLAELQDIVS